MSQKLSINQNVSRIRDWEDVELKGNKSYYIIYRVILNCEKYSSWKYCWSHSVASPISQTPAVDYVPVPLIVGTYDIIFVELTVWRTPFIENE